MKDSGYNKNIFLDISVPIDYCCGAAHTQKVLEEVNAPVIVSKLCMDEFRSRIANWQMLLKNLFRETARFVDEYEDGGAPKSEEEFCEELFDIDKIESLAPHGISKESLGDLSSLKEHVENEGLDVLLDELDTLSESARMLEERLELLIIDERCPARGDALLEAYIASVVDDDLRASLIVHAVNRKQDDYKDMIYLVRNRSLTTDNRDRVNELIRNERGSSASLLFHSPLGIVSAIDI